MDSTRSLQKKCPERLKILASNIMYSEGNTLLHQFVQDNSDPCSSTSVYYINYVLRSMSDIPLKHVNALNNEGYSALHLAVLKNDLLMVNRLLSCLVNIDVNVKCHALKDQNTALHLAVQLANLSVVEELINKGADIDIKNGCETTALCLAAKLDNLDVLKLLINKGGNVNMKDRYKSPLHYVAKTGNLKAVKLLVQNGGEVNASDSNWMTPLHHATRPSGPLSLSRWTFLEDFYVIMYWDDVRDRCFHNEVVLEPQSLEIVKFLVRNGAEVNVFNFWQLTPLHNAAISGDRNMGIIKFLVSNSAHVDALDDVGRTPLHYAVLSGNKSLETVRFLLNRGAQVNVADKLGRTPLHFAAFSRLEGRTEIIGALLREGACLDAVNKDGETPLDIARRLKNQSCVDALSNVLL